MECQSLTHADVITMLQDALSMSGMKIAAFQKALREQQTKCDEKGKAMTNNGNHSGNDNNTTTTTTTVTEFGRQ